MHLAQLGSDLQLDTAGLVDRPADGLFHLQAAQATDRPGTQDVGAAEETERPAQSAGFGQGRPEGGSRKTD